MPALMPRSAADPRTAASTCGSSKGSTVPQRRGQRGHMPGQIRAPTGASRPPPARTRPYPPGTAAPGRRSRSAASRAAAAARAVDESQASAGSRRRPAAPRSTSSGRTARASSSIGSRAMYCPFIQSSFSVLNTALPPLMPSSEKLLDQLRRSTSARGRRPATSRAARGS